jgi:hypothetical protein
MMKKDYSIQHLSKIALVLYSIIFIVVFLGLPSTIVGILFTIFITVFNIAPFFILTINILKSPALWEKITLFTVQIVLSLFAAYGFYHDLYLIKPDPQSSFVFILLPMLGLYPALLLTIGVIKAIDYNKK